MITQKSIKSFCKDNQINVHQIEGNINDVQNLKMLRSHQYDLLISISGNQIFKKDLISLPSKGIINLHTSLLPKYRGLMPTFWVLKNNEEYTGVSVFFVDEGIDTGEIITQEKLKIETKSQHELVKVTKRVGMELIIDSLRKIRAGDELTQRDYVDNYSSYFGFPTKRDVNDFLKSGNTF